MWPLTDTALHLLDEANLISARRCGIELELDGLWRMLADDTQTGLAPDTPRERMRMLDERLRKVLVHAWPVPRDPVVIALRYQAEEMRDALHAQRRRQGREGAAACASEACQQEYCSVENDDAAAYTAASHGAERRPRSSAN